MIALMPSASADGRIDGRTSACLDGGWTRRLWPARALRRGLMGVHGVRWGGRWRCQDADAAIGRAALVDKAR